MRPTHVLETSLYASDLEAARHLSFRCGRGIVHVFIADVTSFVE